MSGTPRFPSPSKQYDPRNEAEFRREVASFLSSIQGLAGTSSGGGVTLPITEADVTGLVADLASKQATIARGVVTKTTGSLANLAEETGTVTLGKSGLILKVVADRACWVRLYATSAERSADATRLITIDPIVPVLADLIFTASLLTINCAPIIAYSNRDTSLDTVIYYSVINRSGSSSTVQLDITRETLEP